MRLPLLLLLLSSAISLLADAPPPVSHSFFMAGSETQIVSGDGQVLWKYPARTRDGFVLPNGNLLLTLSKSGTYPGGAVIEVTRENKIVFEYKGTQSEVNTAQALPNGNVVLTEAGPRPRLLEVDRAGNTVVEFALQCQSTNHHMQSRMARKLPDGNYLVPQLLDKVVREYTPEGKVVWEYQTPTAPANCWPFTAIRLPNGNTVINLTHGNSCVEVDPAGAIVWQVNNNDLSDAPLKDPCGAQVLPNGNVVITSYGAKNDDVKLIELDRQKKVVWTHRNGEKGGIHAFQILDTNGVPVEGAPMK
jgi:hypothetical protein